MHRISVVFYIILFEFCEMVPNMHFVLTLYLCIHVFCALYCEKRSLACLDKNRDTKFGCFRLLDEIHRTLHRLCPSIRLFPVSADSKCLFLSNSCTNPYMLIRENKQLQIKTTRKCEQDALEGLSRF